MTTSSNCNGFSGGHRTGDGQPALSIVIPVYRSQESLAPLVAEIAASLSARGELTYEIVLVNDASPDDSWNKICELRDAGHPIVGINLRKNFGQDNAIMTGLRWARGQFVAIMDDDLQHDPKDLPRLLDKLSEGYDVVYARFRRKRQAIWKNLGSWLNGKLAEWVIGKPPELYLSPYKVLRADIAELLIRYEGPQPYIDGLLFQVTSRIAQVEAEHHPRLVGAGNFTFVKSVRVGLRLALSFSSLPLRAVTMLGVACCLLSAVMVLGVIVFRLSAPDRFPPESVGWASLMTATLFLGGLQLGCMGIVGEYVGRLFLAINRSPQATVAEVIREEMGTENQEG